MTTQRYILWNSKCELKIWGQPWININWTFETTVEKSQINRWGRSSCPIQGWIDANWMLSWGQPFWQPGRQVAIHGHDDDNGYDDYDDDDDGYDIELRETIPAGRPNLVDIITILTTVIVITATIIVVIVRSAKSCRSNGRTTRRLGCSQVFHTRSSGPLPGPNF